MKENCISTIKYNILGYPPNGPPYGSPGGPRMPGQPGQPNPYASPYGQQPVSSKV